MAYPLTQLVQAVQGRIRKDPKALLCSRKTCPRCDLIRKYD